MGNVSRSWFSLLLAIKLSENGISIGVSIYLFTLNACTFLTLQAFTGTLSGLGQYLATESPLKMMKNAPYFTLKAISLLKIFKLLC